MLNNNGNEDDAKDIFQESIIVLYEKVKAGKFELSSKLKTFIYSVCSFGGATDIVGIINY